MGNSAEAVFLRGENQQVRAMKSTLSALLETLFEFWFFRTETWFSADWVSLRSNRFLRWTVALDDAQLETFRKRGAN